MTFSETYASFKDDIAASAHSQWIPGMDYDDIVSEMLICLWKATCTWVADKGTFASYWWSLWLHRKYDLTKMHQRRHGKTEYTDDMILLDRFCGPSSDRMAPDAPKGLQGREKAVWDLLAGGERVNEAIQMAGISKRRYYELIRTWKADEDLHASLLS